MTEKTKARKPRRKLSDIDFSGDGAHIALVGKANGGPANGADYALVIKSKQFSPEFIEKAQQVKVTMELPDFISKFFNIWEGDAKILAYMMGYVEPAETQADEKMEAEEEFQDWIKSRMEAFEIIKSLHESDSLASVLSDISEDEYLAVLHDQETLEKAFKSLEKASKESKDVASATTEDNTSQIGTEVEKEDEVITSVVKQANEENSMTTEVKTVEQEVTVEMVEKAQFELVQKALEEQKVALQKAMETIAQFEAEKKEAIVKAKTAKLAEAVDAKHLEVIAKAALALEADADFDAFVSAMQEMKQAVEKSALFEEQGASGESEEIVKESGVAKILKAKLQSK